MEKGTWPDSTVIASQASPFTLELLGELCLLARASGGDHGSILSRGFPCSDQGLNPVISNRGQVRLHAPTDAGRGAAIGDLQALGGWQSSGVHLYHS